MKPLRESSLRAWLRKKQGPSTVWLCLFDFDGTLSPLVQNADRARLPTPLRAQLSRLDQKRNVIVGIVSGRKLSDIKRRVGNTHFVYAGNHGLEIQARHSTFFHPSNLSSQRALRGVITSIKQWITPWPALWIENKTWTASLHYRQASPAVQKKIPALHASIAALCRKNALTVKTGKKVLEIRPRVAWNKGTAVLWLKKELRASHVLYIGDDQTDEDAFRAVRRQGLAIRVGRDRRSAAPWYVPSHRDMVPLLRQLVDSL